MSAMILTMSVLGFFYFVSFRFFAGFYFDAQSKIGSDLRTRC